MPNPYLIFFQKRKELFVCNGIDISNDDELFVVLHQLRNILAEETERRVGHHHVRFLENLDALIAAEISIALQRRLYIVRKGSLSGWKVCCNDFHFVGLFAGFVVGGDELLQTEEKEVHLEILPEV